MGLNPLSYCSMTGGTCMFHILPVPIQANPVIAVSPPPGSVPPDDQNGRRSKWKTSKKMENKIIIIKIK